MLRGRITWVSIALFLVFSMTLSGTALLAHADFINCEQNPNNYLCEQARTDVTGLPPGCHTATEAEAQINPALRGKPVCPGDIAAGVNETAGTAKQYLKSLPREGSAATDTSIEQLNNSFAICSANFFKAFQKHGGVRITSAYRSAQQEVALCRNNPGCGKQMNNPNPTSNHQRGVAMDVWANGVDQSLLWKFADQNPQFGVCFPFQNGDLSSFRDRPHMVLAGIGGSEGGLCSRRGVTKACDGSGFDPRAIESTPTAQTPTSRLANTLRSYFAPAPQPVSQPQQMCTLSDGRSVPCASIANLGGSPTPGATTPQGAPPPVGVQNTTPYAPGTCAPQFYCQNNNLYYRSSACVDQINQICPKGCSGTSCVGASQTFDLLGSALSDLTNPTTTTDKKSTTTLSAFDQISLLANPTPAEAPTTTPLVLTISGEEATRLEGNPPLSGMLLPQGNVYLTPGAQQTFTSSDLRDTYAPQSVGASQTTLSIMKETLLRVLAYLRPFGRPQSNQYNEYAE